MCSLSAVQDVSVVHDKAQFGFSLTGLNDPTFGCSTEEKLPLGLSKKSVLISLHPAFLIEVYLQAYVFGHLRKAQFSPRPIFPLQSPSYPEHVLYLLTHSFLRLHGTPCRENTSTRLETKRVLSPGFCYGTVSTHSRRLPVRNAKPPTVQGQSTLRACIHNCMPGNS